MIVDSSALLAILFAEPDRGRYAVALDAAPSVRLWAVNFVEAAVRVDMGRSPASDAFDDLIREARVTIEPVTAEQAHLARRAYRTYGRGSGDPARLNLGDCFAYALAKAHRSSRCCSRATISATRMSSRHWIAQARRGAASGEVRPSQLITIRYLGGRLWEREPATLAALSGEGVEHCLGLDQIRRGEAFREPAVDRSQQVARLAPFAEVRP